METKSAQLRVEGSPGTGDLVGGSESTQSRQVLGLTLGPLPVTLPNASSSRLFLRLQASSFQTSSLQVSR